MIQIVKQTHKEKIEMYMKSTKKELIEMLIECNRLLDSKGKEFKHTTVEDWEKAICEHDFKDTLNITAITIYKCTKCGEII